MPEDFIVKWAELLVSAVNEPGMMSAAFSAFHNYSAGSQLLALSQCRRRRLQPGPLATYKGWQGRGRQVRKGERAIVLMVPFQHRRKGAEGDEDQTFISGFGYRAKWFVYSQTDGEPFEIPPVPGWDRGRALASLGVSLADYELPSGNIQGFSAGRIVAVSPVSDDPVKTLLHELAHVTLGHTFKQTRGNIPQHLAEVEAECVCLLVSEALGLPGAEYSRGYIQRWLRGGEIPEENARRILSAADKILKAGQPQAEEVILSHAAA